MRFAFAGVLAPAMIGICQLIAQDAGAPVEMKLTEVEVLRGRVLGLEIGQFQMMANTCLPDPKRPLQEQLDQINKEIQARQMALQKLAGDIVKSRNLDPTKFRVNWQKGQVELIDITPGE